MEKEKLRLSSSRISTYLHCPKAYYWNYIQELEPIQKTQALAIGSFLHTLLDKDALGELTLDFIDNLPEHVKKEFPGGTEEEALTIAYETLNLYTGYKEKYKNDPYEIESSEVHFELETPTFTLYTRLDALLRSQDNRLWRGEYKTTARMDSAYLSGLKNGLQAGIAYWVTNEVLPEKLSGTIYSIMVKTKLPQYERTIVLAEKNLLSRTQECVYAVADGILNQRFYPSMQCHYYNRECEYFPLCKNDTEATREAFFTKRVEFYDKPKI